ncbi:flavin reductase family protein [Streptomyces sp. GMY02]|nr:flavin reductase family protein [Streptomyces sp. GMY02]
MASEAPFRQRRSTTSSAGFQHPPQPGAGERRPPLRADSSGSSLVSADGFRDLMATFPSGVAVVTAFDTSGLPWGMTCSSLCSVTTAPPTLLVCLRQGGPTLAAALQHSLFSVNLLQSDAMEAAELFSSGDPLRFSRVRWSTPDDSGGPHLPDAAHTVADCGVSHTHDAGDHTAVFGEVLRVRRYRACAPLLYGLRQYQPWTTPHRTRSATP